MLKNKFKVIILFLITWFVVSLIAYQDLEVAWKLLLIGGPVITVHLFLMSFIVDLVNNKITNNAWLLNLLYLILGFFSFFIFVFLFAYIYSIVI